MPEQLTFDLPSHAALGLGDFFVSPSNAPAVEAVQGWHDWPLGKLVLCGPTGSGKTHLAHVWAAMTGARLVAACDLATNDIDALASGYVCLEDVDQIEGQTAIEEAVFHLHNAVLERGHSLLITARLAPSRWKLVVPDLQSRMQGTALVTLSAPDDALLSAVLVKLFRDRQLAVDARLISYLMARMERSFAGAGRLVDALDKAALAQKRPITRALAAGVLDKHPESGA